jgi:hypothetical protein
LFVERLHCIEEVVSVQPGDVEAFAAAWVHSYLLGFHYRHLNGRIQLAELSSEFTHGFEYGATSPWKWVVLGDHFAAADLMRECKNFGQTMIVGRNPLGINPPHPHTGFVHQEEIYGAHWYKPDENEFEGRTVDIVAVGEGSLPMWIWLYRTSIEGQPFPLLLAYLDDALTGRNALYGSKKVLAAVESYPFGMETWDELMLGMSIHDLIADGTRRLPRSEDRDYLAMLPELEPEEIEYDGTSNAIPFPGSKAPVPQP